MRAVVERAPLLAAMSRLMGVVERRNTIPIIGNVMISVEARRITLRATDTDMEAVEVIPAATDEPGQTTIPADKLYDIVRNADAGAQITIATRPDDPRILVQSGRSRFNLPAMPAASFPVFDASGFSEPWAFPAKRLADMISRVSFVRGSSDPLTAMSCVCVTIVDGELHVVAAQASGIAIRKEAAPEGAEITALLLPKFTTQAIRWLADVEGDALISSVPDRLVRIEAGESTLTTKVYGGSYVNYQRVLMTEHVASTRTDQDALAVALRRVMIMGEAKAKSVKVTFADGGLTLTARNEQAGDGVDEIACDYEGDEASFLLNADHLQATLGNLHGDIVEIGFAPVFDPKVHSTGQVIIRAPADPAMLVNLMQRRA